MVWPRSKKPKGKRKSKLSHSDCRKRVCFFCFEKSDRALNQAVKNALLSFDQSVSFEDSAVPIGHCNPCRIKKVYLSGNFQPRPLVTLPENFQFYCNCQICQKAKSLPTTSKRFLGGRPEIKVKPKPVVEKTCSICLSIVAKGKSHDCTDKTLKERISQVVANSKSNVTIGQCIASEVLKETEPSPKGTIRLSQVLGGQKLPVVIGSAKASTPKPEISVPSLLELSNQLSVGVGKQKKIATWLNKNIGHGTVEKNFQSSLSDATKTFSDDFELSSMIFSPGQTYELVHVKDLNHFLSKILAMRSLEQHHLLVKMQIDKGQGLLKFCMSIVDLLEDEQEVEYKSSGVRKVFVVAAVPKMGESYKVLQQTLTKINFWDISLQWVFSNDLKMSNLLCGIQPHSASFPCHVCYAPKDDLGTRYGLRTIGTCLRDFDAFEGIGKIRAKAKQCNNQIEPPLLARDFSDATLLAQPIINFIPPCELHILTGVTGHLYKALLIIFPQAIEWPQFLAIDFRKIHGGEFVGNDCKRLLSNVDFLQSLAVNYANLLAMPFVDAFKSLNKVRLACFGKELDPDYKVFLDEFKANTLAIVEHQDIVLTITPKIHFIFFHIFDWCDDANIGLGLVSEQTGESIHHQFCSFFENYKKLPGKTNGERLLRAVESFNAKQV